MRSHRNARPDRWSGFILKGFGIIMGAALVCTIFLPTKSSMNIGMRAAAETMTPKMIQKHLREQIERTTRTFHRGLELVTRNHGVGQELLRLFEENYIPVIPVNGAWVTTQSAIIKNTSFYVTTGLRRFGGLELSASFDQDEQLLMIDPSPTTDCWMGFIGAHEMLHVRDYFMRGKSPPDLLPSDEVRAYELEIDLIDQWTQGRFRKTIKGVAQRLNGKQLTSDSAEVRELNALFPTALSQTELDTRSMVYIIAISFYEAERSGAPDITKEKERRYKKIVTTIQ